MDFNTELLHSAPAADRYGSTQPPIYQVSAFSKDSAETLEKVFAGKTPGFSYSRISNPTVDSFEKRIAALEGGIGAVACSSGMAAVTMALLNILGAGDELIAGSGLFGGTIDLFGDLARFGITVRFVESVTADSVAPLINERTKAVFAELIGNPKLDVVDIKSVAEVCHANGIPLIIDSTTATPYLVRPIQHGADIVVHSASKYINGGGNSIAGVITDSGNFGWDSGKYPQFAEYRQFGRFAYLAKLRGGFWRNSGACLAPFNAFMCSVGLETLGLRMERICDNAYRLAEFLSEQEGVTVNYPALPSSPYRCLVQSQLGGKGGGILTLRAGSKERAFRLVNSLKYALNATNIGDIRTLVIHPASTIYLHSTEKQREKAGVFEDTIRVSVGIENIDDLREDFGNAVKRSKENG
ncbi:MAG TPA: acetyl-L-homoserine sulfhydrolase [Ruminococcaceae bacterium]|nr:acetyl-L-homoserine sulfhydrolase [Oscillospiraceae bacterium]